MEEFVGEPISSEDELWELLNKIISDPEGVSAYAPVEITSWENQLLYFPNEEVGHSIRPAIAKAVTDFHASLSKAYAIALYGQSSRIVLKREDKEALDLILLVTDGSTGLVPLAKAIERLANTMRDKLTGKQVTAIIVVMILVYFGESVAKQYFAAELEAKSEKIEADERIELSKQETERMRLVTEAFKRFGLPTDIIDEAEDGLRGLTKPATNNDRTHVRGVPLTKRQALTILSGKAKEKEGRRLDGEYRVLDINTESDEGYIVRLQAVDTTEEFNAFANYAELSQEDIHVIFEVAEEKSVMHGLVNAFFVGDKISRAYIVRANKLQDSPPNPPSVM